MNLFKKCFLFCVRPVSDDPPTPAPFNRKDKMKQKKSACLIHFKVNYWISCMAVLFPRLKLIFALLFLFLNVSYVFVVSPVCQYSAVLVWNLCLNMHSVTLTGRIFKVTAKKKKKKCLPLSKLLLLLLKPSALIVRKLRVLVNNDQIYFFVFSLMTADIEQKTEVKLWLVIRY